MLLEDILLQAGIEFDRVRGKTDEVMFACPFCTGATDTGGNRRVFGLNLVSGFAHCFRCDWRSRSVVYTARELCKAWHIDFGWRMRLTAQECDETAIKEVPSRRADPSGLPAEYERFGDLSDEIERMAFDYLRSRNLGWDEINEYQIGYAGAGEMAWRVLFPIYGEDGVVYGVAGRDFSGKSKVKYRNSDGMKLLFNGQRQGKMAVVVEGPVDTIAVQRALVTVPGAVAVGALGSVITAEQVAQLSRYETVIHFPDFDMAGIKGAMARADACCTAGMKTKVVIPEILSGIDPGEMDPGRIMTYVCNAATWTATQRLRMRLAAVR